MSGWRRAAGKAEEHRANFYDAQINLLGGTFQADFRSTRAERTRNPLDLVSELDVKLGNATLAMG